MLLAHICLSATLLLYCTQPHAVWCLAPTQERTIDHRPTAHSSQGTGDVGRHAPNTLQQDSSGNTAPWVVGTAVATAGAARLLYLYRQAAR